MASSSGSKSNDGGGSELVGLRRMYYDDLKNGSRKVKVSESRYRCPFCPDRRDDHKSKYLLDHAYRLTGSKGGSERDKARHWALAKFIDQDLNERDRPRTSLERSSRRTQSSPPVTQPEHPMSTTVEWIPMTQPESSVMDHQSVPETKQECSVMDYQSSPVTAHSSPSTQHGHSKDRDTDPNQLFVHPWVAIVANIKTQLQGGRHVGESGSKLRNEFASQGFDPQRVHPLWNYRGHTGFAVVEFKKDWDGFKNAILFDKNFELMGKGKRDYCERRPKEEGIYGWIARDDDYNARGVVGDHLRKMGDLKTVSELEKEDQHKALKLQMNLVDKLEAKKKELNEIKTKYEATNHSMNAVMKEKDRLTNHYNEEMKKAEESTRAYFQTILKDHDKATRDLEEQKNKLLQREAQLRQHQAQNESERKKLQDQKKMNEMATLEQKKADESTLQLAEDHQKEKEKLHKKIIELEKQLDAKHALELEIKHLEGSLQVMEHMEDDDGELRKKMNKMQKELNEKQEDWDVMETLQQTLVVKERQSNDELQDAREELINVWNEVRFAPNTPVAIKRMGDLDTKPFSSAAKKKYPKEEAEVKALELCSEWDNYLRDPNWYPLNVITDEHGVSKGIIDEEDEKLKTLKSEYGDEVYNAVVKAFMEMNECNSSGRYPVSELWNLKEDRKATLKDGVSQLLKQWKSLKSRKKK